MHRCMENLILRAKFKIKRSEYVHKIPYFIQTIKIYPLNNHKHVLDLFHKR